MEHARFFQDIRVLPAFKHGLKQSQVDGFNLILDEAVKRKTPTNDLAYALATVYHETAATMQPVRETLAATDEQAVARLEAAFVAGKLPWVRTRYWLKQAGHYWIGRGYVQLTHMDNYRKMAAITGVDLINHPEYAMVPSVAVKIMFDGMEHGSFTGKGFNDFIDELDESDDLDRAEYKAARKIINGVDKADLIADYAIKFEHALRNAKYGAGTTIGHQPVPLPIPTPKPTPVPTPVGNTTPPAAPAAPKSAFRAFLELIVGWLKGK